MYKFLIFTVISTYSFNAFCSGFDDIVTCSLNSFCSGFDDISTSTADDLDFSWKRFLQEPKKIKHKVHKSIKSLPAYEDPYQKLAGTLTEFPVWGKIKDLVKTKIKNNVRGQLNVLLGHNEVPDRLGKEVWNLLYQIDIKDDNQFKKEKLVAGNKIVDGVVYETWAQARSLAGSEIKLETWHKVWKQIGSEIDTETGEQLMALAKSFQAETKALVVDQFSSQNDLLDPLQLELLCIPFAEDYQDYKLSQTVNSAVDYLLTSHQSKAIEMRKSPQFAQMQNRFAEQIRKIIDYDQVSEIILKLDAISITKKNDFINTELELIYKRQVKVEV